MHVDPLIALGGLLVGFTVGLTGMGGGALMTPMLVLLFRVDILAAVSSDLVVSLIMKPVGGAVHRREGTVRTDLVRWLCVGSVPSAFAGVLILRWLGGKSVRGLLTEALGVALLLAATAIVIRTLRQPGTGRSSAAKPLPTVLIGAFGGLVVGMTSVGSGSLMIVLLMFLYPGLRSNELVGTDLVQAIPLVASAALGHALFGDVRLGLTASLLVGALPGVYAGARLSSRAPDKVVRPALFAVLLASGLRLVLV